MRISIFLTIVLSLFFASTAYCQTPERAIVQSLNETIKPLSSLEPDAGFQDILFMKEYLKGKSVVGIGETTHGTALFDKCRHKLIRFLVSQLEYKAIIDEGDILAAEMIDDYINHKIDTVVNLGGLRPVVTNRKELEWLRAYNSTKEEKDRVHIYGSEVRGFQNILSKVVSLMPVNDKNDQQTISLFSTYRVNYSGLTKADFKNLSELTNRLISKYSDARSKYYLDLLIQLTDIAYSARFKSHSFGVRDRYMFDNVKRLISEVQGSKVILLAHNSHVQKTKVLEKSSLGFLLNEAYGEKYYTIGTDFNAGDVVVFDSKTKRYVRKNYGAVNEKDALEFYLKQCKYPDFILPVRQVLGTQLVSRFVTQKIKMKRNLDGWGSIIDGPIVLADNYDMIVFINDTSNR